MALQLGDEREMPRRERARADDVHIIFDRLARRLIGRLKERADVDVEAEIGEGRRDHLLAAIVPILPHLCDKDARTPAEFLSELIRFFACLLDALLFASFVLVHALDAPDGGLVAAIDFLERAADLADGRLMAGRVDGELKEVTLAALGGLGESVELIL